MDGTIRATEANVASVRKNTIATPGHGPPVSDRAGLKDFGDMLIAVLEKVDGVKNQG
jgi:hypothetical protein